MDSVPKTIQIRSTDEMASWFADWAKEHNMTAGEAFAAMKQAVSENDAVISMPEMQKAIEDYRSYRGMIDSMFLAAIQGQHDAEAKAKEAVQKQLTALTTSLSNAQDELKAAKAEKQASDTARKAAEQAVVEIEKKAEKDIAIALESRKKAEETADAKSQLVDVLSSELSRNKEKADSYDKLMNDYHISETARKDAEQAIKDVKRDAEEAAREAKREAERAQEAAVFAVQKKLEEELSTAEKTIENLREELRAAKSSADLARQEAASARDRAISEVSQKHAEEIEKLRSRLDQRMDELIATQKDLQEAQLQIQRLQTSQ